MMLSMQERNLAGLYLSGSREDTIAQMLEALPDIDGPDVLAAAGSTIAKLESMSGSTFSALSDSLGLGSLS